MTATSNTDSEKEIEDPVERMLRQTGCIELHYQIQVMLDRGQTVYINVNLCNLVLLSTFNSNFNENKLRLNN